MGICIQNHIWALGKVKKVQAGVMLCYQSGYSDVIHQNKQNNSQLNWEAYVLQSFLSPLVFCIKYAVKVVQGAIFVLWLVL